jgi:hypothetical protein
MDSLFVNKCMPKKTNCNYKKKNNLDCKLTGFKTSCVFSKVEIIIIIDLTIFARFSSKKITKG